MVSPNTTARYLLASKRRNPGGEVVTYGSQRVTWGELGDRTFRLAQALIGLGVSPGDRVLFMFHNSPAFVEFNYAVQVAGAIPVPLNYRFTAAEVRHQLENCGARVLAYDGCFAPVVEEAASRASVAPVMVRAGEGALADALPYEELLAGQEAQDPGVPTGPEDVAAIIYTGGTTGFPKGVMLSYGAHAEMFAGMLSTVIPHVALLDLTPAQLTRLADVAPVKVPFAGAMARMVQSRPARWLAARPTTATTLKAILRRYLGDPRISRLVTSEPLGYIIPTLPFFHSASYMLLMMGLMTGKLRFILAGAGGGFDPATVLQTVEAEKPLLMANVPTGWKKLVAHPDIARRDLSSVRICISGAGVCPLPLKRRIFEAFPGAILMDMLGQTEMTPLTAFRVDVGPQSLKERSVGKPIVELRVLDEAGGQLPAGEVGEIAYRSGSMMKGYFADEEGTREVMRGGWFRSGDLGYLDEEGELRLVDRKKECINTGGEKVFPMEVEEVLALHPAVEAACVIGVPDEEWGHKIRAVVQLKGAVEAQALMAHAREDLAGYKVPREIVFVEELPLSPVGKVLRGKIRELYGAAATTESPGG